MSGHSDTGWRHLALSDNRQQMSDSRPGLCRLVAAAEILSRQNLEPILALDFECPAYTFQSLAEVRSGLLCGGGFDPRLRFVVLAQIFESSLGVALPSSLLQHPQACLESVIAKRVADLRGFL